MNNIIVKGVLKNIQPSHKVGSISFSQADLIVPRKNGQEDVLTLKFKTFTNPYKENDTVVLNGNIRSYTYRVSEEKNKVEIYVFTYFDKPEEDEVNYAELDGRICKMNSLHTSKNGQKNVQFILANNIVCGNKRLNSYIPCIAWNGVAKKLSELDVNTKLKVKGDLHSREHTKVHSDGTVELRVAHEFVVRSFEIED